MKSVAIGDGCAIVPASSAIGARLRAAISGLYEGGPCLATPLDAASQRLVDETMSGRVLRGRECREILARLQAVAPAKKPPAPSLRATAAGRTGRGITQPKNQRLKA
jgi:hypothetical protein